MTDTYNEPIPIPDCVARTEALLFPLKNSSPELTTLRNIAVAEGLIERALITLASELTRRGTDPRSITPAAGSAGGHGLIEVPVSPCRVTNRGIATGWVTPKAAADGVEVSWPDIAERYSSIRWAEKVAPPTPNVLAELAQVCEFSHRLGLRCDRQTREATAGLMDSTTEYLALSVGTAGPANGWHVHYTTERMISVPYLPEVFG